jgi:hypothetical protein
MLIITMKVLYKLLNEDDIMPKILSPLIVLLGDPIIMKYHLEPAL